MEERRVARVGTVSGLALLAGGTAVAAVAGGAHSIFATVLLGLLTLGMSHSLLVEIRRQARRRSPGWCRHDTINAVLLAAWAEGAMICTILVPGSASLRAVGLVLSVGYAGACGYFVTERRRTISDWALAAPAPHQPPHLSSHPAASAAPVPLTAELAEPTAGRPPRT
ncbi:hypothetical protein ACWKSP_25470 [Micromonosporaceae bacterium Da 78-11]